MNEPAREKPVDFFISYASEDRPFAERLYELLEARSNSYFDKRSLRSGLAWDDPLLTALVSARVTVAIVSSYTEKAEHQKDEIALAAKRSREGSHRVMPVFLGKNIPDLFGLIRIEGIAVTPDTHVEDVAERLLRALENAPDESEPAAQVPQPTSRSPGASPLPAYSLTDSSMPTSALRTTRSRSPDGRLSWPSWTPGSLRIGRSHWSPRPPGAASQPC